MHLRPTFQVLLCSPEIQVHAVAACFASVTAAPIQPVYAGALGTSAITQQQRSFAQTTAVAEQKASSQFTQSALFAFLTGTPSKKPPALSAAAEPTAQSQLRSLDMALNATPKGCVKRTRCGFDDEGSAIDECGNFPSTAEALIAAMQSPGVRRPGLRSRQNLGSLASPEQNHGHLQSTADAAVLPSSKKLRLGLGDGSSGSTVCFKSPEAIEMRPTPRKQGAAQSPNAMAIATRLCASVLGSPGYFSIGSPGARRGSTSRITKKDGGVSVKSNPKDFLSFRSPSAEKSPCENRFALGISARACEQTTPASAREPHHSPNGPWKSVLS